MPSLLKKCSKCGGEYPAYYVPGTHCYDCADHRTLAEIGVEYSVGGIGRHCEAVYDDGNTDDSDGGECRHEEYRYPSRMRDYRREQMTVGAGWVEDVVKPDDRLPRRFRWKKMFIRVLQDGGSVGRACDLSEVTLAGAWYARRENDEFRTAWDAAIASRGGR